MMKHLKAPERVGPLRLLRHTGLSSEVWAIVKAGFLYIFSEESSNRAAVSVSLEGATVSGRDGSAFRIDTASGRRSCSRPMEGRWIESVGSTRAKTVAGLLWTGSLRTLHSPRRVGLTMQMQCGAADVQQLSRSQEEGITAVPVGKSSVHRAAEGGRFSRSSAMRRPLGYAMSASRPSPTRGACSPCLLNAARSHWILRARRLPAACSHHRRRGLQFLLGE